MTHAPASSPNFIALLRPRLIRGLSRDLAHKFAEILKIKEEYILLESDFMTVGDELKFRNEIMDMMDSAAMRYLKSLGYDISFQFQFEEDEDIGNLFKYCTDNHSDTSKQKLNFTTYSNDILISIGEKSAIAHNIKVAIDNEFEVDLIDYMDMIYDLNDYADFLLSKIQEKKSVVLIISPLPT